jgi:hypothetical protein
MATYIYKSADGTLVSWNPDDQSPVASDQVLSGQGMAKTQALPPLDASHAWDPMTKTVISVTPPPDPRPISSYSFILRFTPAEAAAIKASTDAQVIHWMLALSVSPVVDLGDQVVQNGVNYLAQVGLIAQARVAEILQ